MFGVESLRNSATVRISFDLADLSQEREDWIPQ